MPVCWCCGHGSCWQHHDINVNINNTTTTPSTTSTGFSRGREENINIRLTRTGCSRGHAGAQCANAKTGARASRATLTVDNNLLLRFARARASASSCSQPSAKVKGKLLTLLWASGFGLFRLPRVQLLRRANGQETEDEEEKPTSRQQVGDDTLTKQSTAHVDEV